MGRVTPDGIKDFLARLGDQIDQAETLYLLGGSALCMLGNARQTLDIDYTTTAANASLARIIEALANEMKLELEVVPIEEFIPLPDGAETRHQFIGQFGNLAVYIFDPYSIALSKVARGFESDLEDVVFLIQNKLITLSELDQYVQAALPDAWTFDIDPDDLKQYLAEVYRLVEP